MVVVTLPRFLIGSPAKPVNCPLGLAHSLVYAIHVSQIVVHKASSKACPDNFHFCTELFVSYPKPAIQLDILFLYVLV